MHAAQSETKSPQGVSVSEWHMCVCVCGPVIDWRPIYSNIYTSCLAWRAGMRQGIKAYWWIDGCSFVPVYKISNMNTLIMSKVCANPLRSRAVIHNLTSAEHKLQDDHLTVSVRSRKLSFRWVWKIWLQFEMFHNPFFSLWRPPSNSTMNQAGASLPQSDRRLIMMR